MSEILYREMTPQEFDSWSVLAIKDYGDDLSQNHLYSPEKAQSVSQDSFSKELPNGMATPNNYFRVLEKNHKAVGFLWYKLEDDEAYLSDITIIAESQHQGFGKRLMSEFVSELKKTSASEIELRVSPSNNIALNLYQNMGFRITGYDMSLLLE